MAQLEVHTLSGMMIYTGSNCQTNAQSLADRNYGASDTYIGKLQKLQNGNSSWTKESSYIFVETDTNYTKFGDVINAAYSYTVYKQPEYGKMYMNEDGEFNSLYTYETALNYSFDNAKTYPYTDIVYMVRAINESNYNKQKYYNKNVEVDSLIYKGVKYKWYGATDKLIDAYTGFSYECANQFVSYTTYTKEAYEVETREVTINGTYTYTYITDTPIIGYEDAATYLDTYIGFAYLDDEIKSAYFETYTYTYQYTEVSYTWDYKEDDDFNIISYNTFSMATVTHLNDVLKQDIEKNIDKYLLTHNYSNDNKLYAYYISKADTALYMIMNSYSLGDLKTELLINYDSEYNDLFNNVININIDTSKIGNNAITVTAADEYIFSMTYSYTDVSTGAVKVAKDASTEFKLINKAHTQEDNISLTAPYKMRAIDFSAVAGALVGVIDLDNVYKKDINYKTTKDAAWHTERGCDLEQLIIGNQNTDCLITDIYGLQNIDTLQLIDIRRCNSLVKGDDFSTLKHLHVFDAKGSNLDNFSPVDGIILYHVSLPGTVKSLNLTNIEFKAGSLPHFTKSGKTDINYTGDFDFDPSANLISLTLNNVKGIDTFTFVKTWLTAIETSVDTAKNDLKLLYSGLVNYISITDVDWANADLDTILKLKYLGIDKFTGKVNVKGSGTNGALTRKEYSTLKDVYGEATVKSDMPSALKFTYTLVDGCYKMTIKLPYYKSEQSTDENGETITIQVKDYYLISCTLNDNDTTNKLLDMMYMRNVIFDNYRNVGYIAELNESITTVDTYYPSELAVGDIVLYKGTKIIIVYSDTKNIVNNYIKLGTVNRTSIDDLKACAKDYKTTIADLLDASVQYVENIKVYGTGDDTAKATNIKTYNIDLVNQHDSDTDEIIPYEVEGIKYIVEPSTAHNTEVEFKYDEAKFSYMSINEQDNFIMFAVDKVMQTSIEISAKDNSGSSAIINVNVTDTIE